MLYVQSPEIGGLHQCSLEPKPKHYKPALCVGYWMISIFTKRVIRVADIYTQPSLCSFSKAQLYIKSLVPHLKSQFTGGRARRDNIVEIVLDQKPEVDGF